MTAVRFAPFLWSALILAACQSGSEQPGADGVDPRGGRPTAPAESQAVLPPSPQVDSAVNRTPQTDPWLFEGIPNFEDLVAGREGDWLVVLGSAERVGGTAATIMKASDPGLAAIQQRVWNAGAVPFAVASEEIPTFAPGLTVLVLGPYPKQAAEERLAELRGAVPDAYVKAGW